MICKLKGQMEKGHYDVQIMMDEKRGIVMCNLTGRMDK